jgi:hypothetical protein
MTSKAKVADVFYWIGVVTTAVCLALVVVANTEWGYRLEHTDWPVSWMMAGIAMVSFLVAETCDAPSDEIADERLSEPSVIYEEAFEI